MLLFMIPIATANLMAVDISGMNPQIRIIRSLAQREGWPITCEGRRGEEKVIRISFPKEITPEAADALWGFRHKGSSSVSYYRGQRIPTSCNLEPSVLSASATSSVLGIGPEDVLNKAAATARDCGFKHVTVRQRRPADDPWIVNARADWNYVLDAGEDVISREGPSLCYIQMAPDLVDDERSATGP